MNNDQKNLSNVTQTDYYNNNDYYSNNNYDNNYSDTTYEEKEKKNGVWWKILLVILVLLIIIFLLLKFCGGNGKKSQDEMYAELSARICTAAETYIMNNPSVLDRTAPGKSAIIRFQTLADSNLIEAQIQNPYYDGGLFKTATQDKYYSMNNSVRLTVLSDGTLNCELVDNSNDVTPPELRLNGDAEITLALGTEFEDPGYTATDDYDGDITDKVAVSGNVNSATAGVYELTYTVQDGAGNVATKKRKIIYEEYADIEITLGSVLDGVTPQISLKGANPYCMVKGTKYVEPGATATDNVDGNITNKISVTNKVTGNLMGSFRVVYKVEDSSGNEAIAYRAVIVTTSCPGSDGTSSSANTKPTITLVGKNSVTINKGTEYIDLGATAYDKEDGDITSKIITDSTGVNFNSAGVYKVIYRVTDSAGVTVSASRTVTVKDNVSGNPVVRFAEEKKNIDVVVGSGNDSLIAPPKAVNENGVPVSVTTKIEDYLTKEGVSQIDWNNAGKYRVIYTAIHGNGVLKQTKNIVVTVFNDKVTIGGKDAINVILRDSNCDINEADLVSGGVTFEVPGESTPIVTLTGNVGNACKIGTYEVVVEAKVNDSKITKKSITAYVVNGTPIPAPVGQPGKVTITGNSANPINVYNTNNLWTGGSVSGITLTFSSIPAVGTEIAHFEWSKDCNTVGDKVSKLSNTLGTMTWTETGSSNVCIRAVTTTNVAGPWSDPVKLNIDRTGPSVSFTHTWEDDKEDWHSASSMTLEYNASDFESGLSHFEYTYDDVKAKKAEEIVTYNEATGRLVVNENTEPTRNELFVYVRAVDKAGNRGEWTLNPAYVNLDTVKPNAPVLEVVGNNTKLVKINTTFNDGQSVRPSGFGSLIYTINDGEELRENVSTITLPTNTTSANVAQYVKVWAVDKAGNRSDDFASSNVIIAPGTNVTGVTLKNGDTIITNGALCSNAEVNPNSTFTLTATAIPVNADIKDVIWSVTDASVAVIDENGKVTAKKAGTATVTAKIGSASTTCTINVSSQVKQTIKYDCNGGSGIMPDTLVSYGTAVTLPTSTCVKVVPGSSGMVYYFKGWTTDRNSTTIKYADKATISDLSSSGFLTLYAVYDTLFSAQLTYEVVSEGGTNWNIKLKSSGTFTLNKPTNMDIFVVGGGGSGSAGFINANHCVAGGGGGGGYTATFKNMTIGSNTPHSVVIGSGGAATSAMNGNDGGESYFISSSSYKAKGGSAGQRGHGGSGGSGGGAFGASGGTYCNGANGGSNGTSASGGCGGYGNGSGQGTSTYEFGVSNSTLYSGGGGGGSYSGYSAGLGGAGGGANGGSNTTTGVSASNNTGGGGGGGGCYAYGGSAGGAGGSGIIVLRNPR